MRDQCNMACRPMPWWVVETDQHAGIIIVKPHRVATADGDPGGSGAHA